MQISTISLCLRTHIRLTFEFSKKKFLKNPWHLCLRTNVEAAAYLNTIELPGNAKRKFIIVRIMPKRACR